MFLKCCKSFKRNKCSKSISHIIKWDKVFKNPQKIINLILSLNKSRNEQNYKSRQLNKNGLTVIRFFIIRRKSRTSFTHLQDKKLEILKVPFFFKKSTWGKGTKVLYWGKVIRYFPRSWQNWELGSAFTQTSGLL